MRNLILFIKPFLFSILTVSFLYQLLERNVSTSHPLLLGLIFIGYSCWVARREENVKIHSEDPSLNVSGKIVDLATYKRRKKRIENESKSSVRNSSKQTVSWETVFSTPNQLEAEMAKTLLTKSGINSHIANHHVASMIPTAGAISFQLEVKKEDASRALQVLRKYDVR